MMVFIILAVVCVLIFGATGFLIYCDVSSSKMDKSQKTGGKKKK
jgi:Trk-type K+ transport system membrane component